MKISKEVTKSGWVTKIIIFFEEMYALPIYKSAPELFSI